MAQGYPGKDGSSKEVDEVVGGSLGKLLASYGSNTSSEEEEESEVKTEKTASTEEAPPATSTWPRILLPNPFHDANKSNKSLEMEASGSQAQQVNEVKIKEEPVEESGPPMDFGSIRENHEKEEDQRQMDNSLELDVDDFLGPGDAYKEAREIKLEVESSGSSDSEEDSADSDEEASSEDEDEYEERVAGGAAKGGKRKPDGPRVKGEFRLSDLPPIEDLHISVPHEECKPIGVIKSVVDPLVVVEALPDTPALDLESVLFLEEGDRALGHIFDVIGPVKQPMYCVRFNSLEHIEKNQIKVGMSVYCAPKTPYTSYIFLAQLRRLKGSDASWCNDIEPPQEEVEYSDDEQERIARKKKNRNRRRRARLPGGADTDNPEVEGEKQQQQHFEHRSRGRKRNFNQVPRQPPPFMPPMVPGFFPPNFNAWNHPRGPPRGPPFHRGGYRGSQRFRGGGRPPPPNPEQFWRDIPQQQFQNPNIGLPQPSRPWHYPNQWDNQVQPNLNFSSPIQPNPYHRPSASFNNGHLPQPPPPPPPPPPGEEIRSA